MTASKTQSNQKILRYLNDPIDLTEKNFTLFAAKHYENSQCSNIEEFDSDLAIPIHIKKLFTRYHTKDELKERLILNHTICFFNVFEPIAACKILFFKIDKEYHSYLKTVLLHLNRAPDYLLINSKILNVKMIKTDHVLLEKLRKATNE